MAVAPRKCIRLHDPICQAFSDQKNITVVMILPQISLPHHLCIPKAVGARLTTNIKSVSGRHRLHCGCEVKLKESSSVDLGYVIQIHSKKKRNLCACEDVSVHPGY
ncbi:hypothetical protein TNCV_1016891 [Trichonephila clavipes]|uniref:Uncharacterized protein n=1 Tax=Trichonephila clavipes TaxID=2585209 RepID=A0A8X6VY75_TRICX|nr:hypothetical protein TNCV_1016891 [Trichonephila clavipes]